MYGDNYYGAVQVCIGGIWGSLCRDSFWDNKYASVVCKQLGFSSYGMIVMCIVVTWSSNFKGLLAIKSAYYNNHNDSMYFTGLNFNGTEDDLFNCAINTSAPACSSIGNDSNIVCPG